MNRKEGVSKAQQLEPGERYQIYKKPRQKRFRPHAETLYGKIQNNPSYYHYPGNKIKLDAFFSKLLQLIAQYDKNDKTHDLPNELSPSVPVLKAMIKDEKLLYNLRLRYQDDMSGYIHFFVTGEDSIQTKVGVTGFTLDDTIFGYSQEYIGRIKGIYCPRPDDTHNDLLYLFAREYEQLADATVRIMTASNKLMALYIEKAIYRVLKNRIGTCINSQHKKRLRDLFLSGKKGFIPPHTVSHIEGYYHHSVQPYIFEGSTWSRAIQAELINLENGYESLPTWYKDLIEQILSVDYIDARKVKPIVDHPIVCLSEKGTGVVECCVKYLNENHIPIRLVSQVSPGDEITGKFLGMLRQYAGYGVFLGNTLFDPCLYVVNFTQLSGYYVEQIDV